MEDKKPKIPKSVFHSKTCELFAETTEVTSKRFSNTISMRSASPNGWKRAQSAPTALRASQTSLGITAIANFTKPSEVVLAKMI